MNALWVQIVQTRGSAPREPGTAMKVTTTATEGTIGGGALEFTATARARALLQAGDRRDVTETIPLGPDLGQCCGGSVRLRYTRMPCATDPVASVAEVERPDHIQPLELWIWGAGHVGRATVAACPAWLARIAWVDSAQDRFPETIPDHATAVVAADMPLLAARAPRGTHHLILTYSHQIDLELCAALLQHGGGAFTGLIGSKTKWMRFQARLRAMGLDPSAITCPIGDTSLGKAPEAIARGVVAALAQTASLKEVPA